MTSAEAVLALRSGSFSLARVRVMGILNRTPDSFYDGGRYQQLEDAVARAHEMVDEGADIIDVGGEKAGPGEAVTAEEEIRRVVPIIRAIRDQLAVPISVDTFKPQVAEAAMEAGADIINSIDGFRDPEMRRVAARTAAGIVVMHIQGRPRVANPNPHYHDVVGEVRQFLVQQVVSCLDAGISNDRIIIDPGPGFGKTTNHDLAVLRNLERFTDRGYPLLLAVSRKRFIGDVLDMDVGDRLEGSLAVSAWGVLRGARIIRAHDVRATKRVCQMVEAVLDPDLVGAATT